MSAEENLKATNELLAFIQNKIHEDKTSKPEEKRAMLNGLFVIAALHSDIKRIANALEEIAANTHPDFGK